MSGIRSVFTISLYAVVCVAAVMIAFAEGNWLLPAALTVPIAIVAYRFVELRGGGLPTYAANALGLLAIGVALVELAVRDVEGRLLFGAHLLIYLTWILLWQRKRSQQRWGLIALAVLQVAIGGVLTTSGQYGMAMAFILVLAVWTLVLLQLLEAEERQTAIVTLPAGGAMTTPAVLVAPGSVAPVGQAAAGRWPLRQLIAVTAVTLAGALAIGGSFFALVPRFEFTRQAFEDSDEPLARQRRTGFTERVRLGAFGEILESNVKVFDVRLYDAAGTPLDVEDYALVRGLDEPLFRGAVLGSYSNGEWTTDSNIDTSILPGSTPPRCIRQEFRLRPMNSEVLFSMAPVYAGAIDDVDIPIRWRPETQTLSRPRSRRMQGELTYELYSPADPNNANTSGNDRFFEQSAFRRWIGRLTTPDDYLELPAGLEQLEDVAAAVARPPGQTATDAERGRRLLTYLRDSGNFRYTLTGELIDPSVDPVVDFLVNRKQGHCEYFATALALMLRAEGVPSRVVNGFKGGEKNRLSGAFEVQERHAHAWVEAYIDDRWATLDPSPSSERNTSVEANAPRVPLWNDFRSAISQTWRDYIVGLNLSRQRRTLEPLRRAAVATAIAWRENWWPALQRHAYALATDPSRWFSWQGGVITFVGLLLLVAAWWVGRRLFRRAARLRARREALRRHRQRVEFYERFRRLCHARGWFSPPGLTPREFASDMSELPAIKGLPARLSDLPRELTEEFYGVRFGSLELSEPQLRDLNARLTEMENALNDAVHSGRNGRARARAAVPHSHSTLR